MTGRLNPAAIDRVMRVSDLEPDGDHFLSHFVLARKVLGESASFAIRVAHAFKHRRLTRSECEGMVSDWLTDESECAQPQDTEGKGSR
jgi:hypothetical protein